MSAFYLHLMRHGAPETPGLLLGRTDAAPTPAGIATCIQQATDLPFKAVVSSDLTRSATAANAIAELRGVSSGADPRWRELDFGRWDGLAPADVGEKSMADFWDDPDANPPPEGEQWSSLVARVAAAIDDIPERDTLVVAHGGSLRAALAAMFGFDQRQLWAFDLPYSAVLTLRLWPGTPRSAQIAGLWA